jgi:hypothetical protein
MHGAAGMAAVYTRFEHCEEPVLCHDIRMTGLAFIDNFWGFIFLGGGGATLHCINPTSISIFSATALIWSDGLLMVTGTGNGGKWHG